MALCLTITSYHKITPGQCPEKLLENGAISVGRAADNDWVLPDPERLVSSKHCVIQFKDGRYYLTDNSTNGVELVHAGIRLRRGNSEPLMDGEVIRIGDYEIQARIDAGLSIPVAGQPQAHSFEALMANQAAAPSAPAPGPADASDALLQAFLRGAGIEHLRIDAADAAAQMEAVGRSYRLMVEGLIDVLRARSSLKGEFRMQQTTIAPVRNNPLKFAPNADEALLLLLREGNQAFMAPDQAVRDSFDDLRAHQLAVMAGVEAAIKHLLKRFEPARLEQRLAPAAGLAKLFGGSRQAHCWQQFTELYSQISREAEDDFQDLFGREFSRAYEAHSQRMQRS
ncbi:type VI secretion system-associated FHA domain protein TagH [Pseudomonas mosselii]|uniref:type VI secretion system-associated FHA domain protein TagH n=1 Tax=Pseudomonas mosselii TaxID=78327 RepID=UPI002448DE10|nr:type VI secretion system-associated FHA domain protein TagH [Pseudomonas mosselii]MDH1141721.1 type VI secretion system-associated FHA domain protein TagH [Pseudomonas mosselii]